MASDSLATLVVRMDADSAKLRSELGKAGKVLKEFSGTARKVEGSVGSLASTLKGGLAFAGIALSVGAVTRAITSSVKAFAEEEKQSRLLSSSLTRLGYDAAKLVPSFQAMQKNLERTTLFQDDAIAGLQSMLLNFGLAPGEIGATTKALLDWSTATGKDATAGALALNKALKGDSEELRALGVEVKRTGDFTTDLNAIVGQLNTQFGGQAEAAASGMAGTLHRLETSMDDLSKSFGGFIGQLETKLGVIQKITDALNGMRMALGGATPEELDQKRSNRINELLGERMAAQGNLDNPILRLKAQAEIIKINAEIRRLQQESAAAIQGGVQHGSLHGNTSVPKGVSDKSKKIRAGSGAGDAKDLEAIERRLIRAEHERLSFMEEMAKKRADLDAQWEESRTEKLQTEIDKRNEFFDQVDKWVQMKKDEAYDKSVKAFKDQESARASLGDQALGLVPEVGQLVSTASAGATAGGPWGAVAAVAADLLSRSEAFAGILESVSTFVGMISDSLGSLLLPLLPVINEVFAAVGGLFVAMEPVLTLVGESLAVLLSPLRMVALAILEFSKLLADITGADKGKIQESIDRLNKKQTGAQDDATDSLNDMTKAVNAVTGATLNLPAWYRGLPGARLDSDMNTSTTGASPSGNAALTPSQRAALNRDERLDLKKNGPKYAAKGAVVDAETLAIVGEAGRELILPEPTLRHELDAAFGRNSGGLTINAAFYGLDAASIERAWEQMKRLAKRDHFQQTGRMLPAGG